MHRNKFHDNEVEDKETECTSVITQRNNMLTPKIAISKASTDGFLP